MPTEDMTDKLTDAAAAAAQPAESGENNAAKASAEAERPPVDYSRYMGTLNRIYRRGNSPNARKLGDSPAAQSGSAADGKKDHSFIITLGVILAAALVIWLVKTYLL